MLTIYGCYVIGQLWYFVVFTHQDYATARPLDATNASELERIFQYGRFLSFRRNRHNILYEVYSVRLICADSS